MYLLHLFKYYAQRHSMGSTDTISFGPATGPKLTVEEGVTVRATVLIPFVCNQLCNTVPEIRCGKRLTRCIDTSGTFDTHKN